MSSVVVRDQAAVVVREPDITYVTQTAPPQRVVTVENNAYVVVVETEKTVTIAAPGPQGPPGPAGGFTFHLHTQSSPSSSWVINHNLGRRAHVTVYVPDGVEVEADVVHNTDDQVVITFATPEMGTALIA